MSTTAVPMRFYWTGEATTGSLHGLAIAANRLGLQGKEVTRTRILHPYPNSDSVEEVPTVELTWEPESEPARLSLSKEEFAAALERASENVHSWPSRREPKSEDEGGEKNEETLSSHNPG